MAAGQTFVGGRQVVGVLVLRGLGGGRLDREVVGYPLGSEPAGITVADVNKDGDPDLLVVNPNDNAVAVLVGGAGTSFTELARVPVGVSPRGLAVADLNGDGNVDFAVANRGSNTVSVRYGDGTGNGGTMAGPPAPGYVSVVDGSSQGTGRVVVSKVGDYAGDVSVADLDGTADLDVVTTRGQFVVAAVFDPLT